MPQEDEDPQKAVSLKAEKLATCKRIAAEAHRKIGEQLELTSLFDCRIPEGAPEFTDPRRSLQLLSSYWSLCGSIALHLASMRFAFQPNPLLRIVMNLRFRIDAYFERLADLDGVDEAREAANFLLEAAADSESADISAILDSTHMYVQTVDTFLEESRLKCGSKKFSLMPQERMFIDYAEEGVKQYHVELAAAVKRKLDEAASGQLVSMMVDDSTIPTAASHRPGEEFPKETVSLRQRCVERGSRAAVSRLQASARGRLTAFGVRRAA